MTIGFVVEYWVFGSVGPLLQVLMFIAVTFVVLLREGSQVQGWPQRKDTLDVAKRSGLAMAAVGCIAYGFGYYTPDNSFNPSKTQFYGTKAGKIQRLQDLKLNQTIMEERSIE